MYALNVSIKSWNTARYPADDCYSLSYGNVIDRNGKVIKKPEVVVDYNARKGFIDLSGQLGLYHTSLRKSVKWYRNM